MKQIFLVVSVLWTAVAAAQINPGWMRQAKISPDGQHIAFCYGGDIYVVKASGGEAVLLVGGPSYESSPVWAPSGKSIAFASDRHGNDDVFVVSAQGGTTTRLTYHSAYDRPHQFTPDGQQVLFSSARVDRASNQQYPSGAMPELYAVSVDGGPEKMVSTTPMLHVAPVPGSARMVYQDQKGYEDDLRKHHTSSVTRDLWIYDPATNTHNQLTSFTGEDLNPVFAGDANTLYYLSEQAGTMNVFAMDLATKKSTAITTLDVHPVRHLSGAQNGMLCFTHHGKIMTMAKGQAPKAIEVKLTNGMWSSGREVLPVQGASEVAVSPNGKEIAFVFRGEVFVASVQEGTTKRITNTPEQERSVSFSPDGRAVLYAGERNGSWNIYRSMIERTDEPYFFLCTVIKEEALVSGPEETFQPSFSPDGTEIAYLESRTALKVFNIASKAVREILPASANYSYSDGDQNYQWSPDGKWFLVNYFTGPKWLQQNGLVAADGKSAPIDLSQSGYGAFDAQWMMDGKMITWLTQRDGMKNHASWGGEIDVYGGFLDPLAFDEFLMNEEEFAIYSEAKKKKEDEEKAKKEEEDKKAKDKQKDKKKDKKEESKTETVKPIVVELEHFKERKKRLTIHSSELSDAYVTKDGSKLIYMTRFEKGYDIWQTNLRTKETKILAKMGTGPGAMVADKEGKNLFIISDGMIHKLDIEKGESKPIAIKGEMALDAAAERMYLFEHIWKQVKEKFYVTDLHGVKWDVYYTEYKAKVPEVYNAQDFAELMSEMLGELNASHTGAFYGSDQPLGDKTAGLGLFYDQDFTGDGLKIEEIMPKNPVVTSVSKIKKGVIIEAIDGNKITTKTNPYALLNRKEGVNTLLDLFDPTSNTRWQEVVKPIALGHEYELMYRRWVERCAAIVDSLSGGTIGYVHVRGMDDRSYREVYDVTLGKHAFKKALIVDTRFNGGGWLHEDLVTFLSGKEYISFQPRGQNLGGESDTKWTKPSAVVMNEANYSDAHMFPFAYKELQVGPLVGMPVAGTGTAVWWEGLQNGVVFGIPQVGMVDKRGQYLENQQLEPDYHVPNEPSVLSKGRDQQLEKAVEVLMRK